MSRRVLYLEPLGGIAGDMFLAAAIDLGVSPEELQRALASLPLPPWRFAIRREARHEICGTHVDVEVDAPAEAHAHRALSEIRQMIRSAVSMPERARERALAMFELLGEAEAKVHGVLVEEIHFHEVGAVDSIVDLCGAAVVLELLGDPELRSAPPPLGSGTVRTAHGAMPVPAPATLELLRGVPVSFEGVGELTTPTGAAILRALAKVEPPSVMTVERVGYGVGTKDFADRPNVLRAALGRAGAEVAAAVVVEANLDDCSPQLLGGLLGRVLELGAIDAFVAPVTMKKSRPGHLFSALVPEQKREAIVAALLRETTTLGVRYHRVERLALERRFEEVDTPYGRVRVKLGLRDGEVVNAAPEYEDCVRLAQERGAPVKQVWAAAFAAWTFAAR